MWLLAQDAILAIWCLPIRLVLVDGLQKKVSCEDFGDASVLARIVCEDVFAED